MPILTIMSISLVSDISCENSNEGFDPKRSPVDLKRIEEIFQQSQASSSWLPEADKPYTCSSCGKCYTHIFTLNRHRRTVCGKIRNTSGKWKCPRCSRAYATEGNLMRHIKFECGVRRRFICIICNHRFTQRCSLLRHLKSFHNQ